jgi:hypothetical protein
MALFAKAIESIDKKNHHPLVAQHRQKDQVCVEKIYKNNKEITPTDTAGGKRSKRSRKTAIVQFRLKAGLTTFCKANSIGEKSPQLRIVRIWQSRQQSAPLLRCAALKTEVDSLYGRQPKLARIKAIIHRGYNC